MQTANHIKTVHALGCLCLIGFILLVTSGSSTYEACESNCEATTGTAQVKTLTAALAVAAELFPVAAPLKLHEDSIGVNGRGSIGPGLPIEVAPFILKSDKLASSSIKNDKLSEGVVTYQFTTTTATGAVRAFASYCFNPPQVKCDQEEVASQIRSMEIGDRL